MAWTMKAAPSRQSPARVSFAYPYRALLRAYFPPLPYATDHTEREARMMNLSLLEAPDAGPYLDNSYAAIPTNQRMPP